MRVPESLASLVDMGVIAEVLRPLLSGKEAEVFLVEAGGQRRVAKVYKEAHIRSFKNRADYVEGRSGRNSRDRRAIAKRSRHGREKDELAWRSAEVEAIYKLRMGGVRVPEPYNYMDGVLVMELVQDADGNPAPRLGELSFEPDHAKQIFDHLLQEVVRMLCAGVVHADLSDFNVLMAADGPVIIDFPQAVDPATNNGARRLLMRDVDNLLSFLERFVPGSRRRPYAEEMWALYEANELTPETKLLGQFQRSRRKANADEVLALIGDAERDEQRRRAAQGAGPGRGGRGRSRGGGGRGQGQPSSAESASGTKAKTGTETPVARGRWVEVKIAPPAAERGRSRPAAKSSTKPEGSSSSNGGRRSKPEAAPAANADAPPPKRRRRRRRRKSGPSTPADSTS
ncbi:MAG: PA4780 family RIO1-like protein kinase [Nannocystaceae bacterium]